MPTPPEKLPCPIGWERGDWEFDPNRPEWDNPAIPRRRIPQSEYADLAAAIVRGASVSYAIIEDFRALIDAVQHHPNARLMRAMKDDKKFLRQTGVTTPDDAPSDEAPTRLELRGCVVETANCKALDIGCTLQAQARFAGHAEFGLAAFSGDLDFFRAAFDGGAYFGGAAFTENANFMSAIFDGRAFFLYATFAGVARFKSCTFAMGAYFESTRFASHGEFGYIAFGGYADFRSSAFASRANFESAAFVGSAGFKSASFAGDVRFNSASFAGNANFGSVAFAGDVHFDSASFAGIANFGSVAFAGDARFGSASFTGNANFWSASFAGDARFGSSSFANYAGFVSASFAENAGFRLASFAGGASFRYVSFAKNAGFRSASFAGNADFGSASFAENAGFRSASFAKNANFGLASFAGKSGFRSASFAGNAGFRTASFAGNVNFESARFAMDANFSSASFENAVSFNNTEINRRLLLADSSFRPTSRLDVKSILIRAGASLHLSREQLTQRESESAMLHRWCEMPDTVRIWLWQYIQAAILIPIHDLVSWLEKALGSTAASESAFGLGYGRRGTLVAGEDSRDPEQLKAAAVTYSILRDHFKTQPGAQIHEDICAIKSHDLYRRGCRSDVWWRQPARFLHWLVMRNALGYLIYPSRILITGALLILSFTALYAFAIAPGDIGHSEAPIKFGSPYGYWMDDWLNPFYFSITTFVTLGYGDFAPTAGWLKLAAAFEGLFGVTLLALFTVSWGRKMIR